MAEAEEIRDAEIKFSSPPSILFVCGGNQGRSLACELIARAHCPSFKLKSAGVFAVGDQTVDPQLVSLMSKKGISCEDYKPAKITAESVDNADLILSVSNAYKDETKKAFSETQLKNGALEDKIFRVTDWTQSPDEMPDPVIMAEKFYAIFLQNVEEAVLSAFVHFGLLDDRPEVKFTAASKNVKIINDFPAPI